MGSHAQRVGLGVVLASLAAGCAGPRESADRTVTVAAAGVAPSPEAEPEEPVALRRHHSAEDRYEVTTRFDLNDSSLHADISYKTRAVAVVAPDGEGGFLARGTFGECVLTHDDEVDPLGGESDLAGVEVSLWLDARSRVTGDRVTGQSLDNGAFASLVGDSLRAVRLVFPDHPVRPGDSWTGETVRWDTRPAGWVVVSVEPTYTLESIVQRRGRRYARIRWNAVARVEPFEVMGISLSGRAPMDGLSIVSLDDGYTGRHQLSGSVELFVTGRRTGSPTEMARVRIRQDVARADPR